MPERRNYMLAQQTDGAWDVHLTVWSNEPDDDGITRGPTSIIASELTFNEALDQVLLAQESTLAGADILVRDQDEQPIPVQDVFRGFNATVVHIDVDKPPTLLSTEDAVMALAAALLGVNLHRGKRVIATNMQNELNRMGFGLTTKEVKRT